MEQITPTLSGAGQMHYAGFWRRFLAIMIDAVLIEGIMFVVYADLSNFNYLSAADMNAPEAPAIAPEIQLISIVIYWLYFALMQSSPIQGTIGKLMLGIKVTDLDGNQIGFGRATGRFFAKFISQFILLIGYIMVAFTQRKQGLHDMLAGTLVVLK